MPIEYRERTQRFENSERLLCLVHGSRTDSASSEGEVRTESNLYFQPKNRHFLFSISV